MSNKNYKAFIVEGNVREPQIVNNLQGVHFKHTNFKIITIPAGQNIYMLWKRLNEDEFETDIIEVLREMDEQMKASLEGLRRSDFSEIFLFFDYDVHQNNLSERDAVLSTDVVEQMLQNFDNETENGKLYISYPMVEAVRDFIPSTCGDGQSCKCEMEQVKMYKYISGQRATYSDIRKYTYSEWQECVRCFAMKISCLFDCEGMILYENYRKEVSPDTIFRMQRRCSENGYIYVLSAFPQFLLDYFPIQFWNSNLMNIGRMVCAQKRGGR